jgi:hypothetical protein
MRRRLCIYLVAVTEGAYVRFGYCNRKDVLPTLDATTVAERGATKREKRLRAKARN